MNWLADYLEWRRGRSPARKRRDAKLGFALVGVVVCVGVPPFLIGRAGGVDSDMVILVNLVASSILIAVAGVFGSRLLQRRNPL